MNLVLLEPHETHAELPRSDRRVQHVLTVLRRTIGEDFDAGVINGPRGKAKVTRLTDTALTLAFTPLSEPPPPAPIKLIVGLPRPQTARDVLREATTLGVAELHFVRAEKSEASYAQSTLWSSGEWRRHVLAGAEQAFETRIPIVSHGTELARVVDTACLPDAAQPQIRIALDNYEAELRLSQVPLLTETNIILAVGPERGWSNAERTLFRRLGFQLAHLGARVLRTETAVIAAITLARSKLGLM